MKEKMQELLWTIARQRGRSIEFADAGEDFTFQCHPCISFAGPYLVTAAEMTAAADLSELAVLKLTNGS